MYGVDSGAWSRITTHYGDVAYTSPRAIEEPVSFGGAAGHGSTVAVVPCNGTRCRATRVARFP